MTEISNRLTKRIALFFVLFILIFFITFTIFIIVMIFTPEINQHFPVDDVLFRPNTCIFVLFVQTNTSFFDVVIFLPFYGIK